MHATAHIASAACLLVCGACGDNFATPPDAQVVLPDGSPLPGCWPSDGLTPTGWATLGTGTSAFEPMPTMLPIEYGTQEGFDLVANVKMKGLVPGNPNNILDPTNPRTRIRAYFANSGVPLNASARCPWRYGYVPADDGNYVMSTGVAVVFDICWRSGNLIGQQVKIELELVDANGGFVRTSETVTLATPLGLYPIEPAAICTERPPARNDNAALRLD